MSAWLTTWSSYCAGGARNQNRSWPLCAATSAAARAGMSAWLMWSTRTSVSFASPQRLTYVLSNHTSYAGTKWLHCAIRSVPASCRCAYLGAPATAGFASAPP